MNEENTQETTEVVADDSAQPEPEKSQREIELEEELDKWQKEAKAHQKTASKKSEEAQRWQNQVSGLTAKVTASDVKFDVLAEMLEERFSENTEEYGEPKRKSTFQERVASKTKKQPDPKIAEEVTHRKSVAQEIIALTDSKGKPFDKTPEFDRAYTRFMLGDADSALEMVKEITEKMADEKEKPKESEEARIDRLVNERLKQKAIEDGEAKSETGQPSSASLSDLEAIAKYNHGEMPFGELPESAKKRIK